MWGVRVDKQFLLSIEEVAKDFDSCHEFTINVECDNNATYILESIEELFDCFQKKPYRIKEIEMNISFGQKKNGNNKVVLYFSNDYFTHAKIKYQFDNIDDYLLFKTKVEQCMNNYKLWYYPLSKIPIVPILSIVAFMAICIYTSMKSIIFEQYLQIAITIIFLCGLFVPFFVSTLRREKRAIFPFTEFRIGQNKIVEQRNEKTRNFIVFSLAFAVVLGVLVNALSKLMFG